MKTTPLRSCRAFIIEQINSGKSNQEVYNDAVMKFDVKIHEVAETIRRTVPPARKNRFSRMNIALFFLLALLILAGIAGQTMHSTYLIIIPGLGAVLLVYGLYTFKYPAHLLTGVLMTTMSATFLLLICLAEANLMLLLQFFLAVSAAVIAYMVHTKIFSDYTLNRDMLKQDPNARVDVITFH